MEFIFHVRESRTEWEAGRVTVICERDGGWALYISKNVTVSVLKCTGRSGAV